MGKGYSCVCDELIGLNAEFSFDQQCAREAEVILTGMNDAAIDAGVRMGHVHLKVADL